MRPQHSSRTPPFVLIGLLVVCAILAFNYWNASSKNNMLVKDMGELQNKFRTLSMKKVAVEKRNDALLEKLKEGDTELARHKTVLGEKEGDVENLKKAEDELQSQLEDVKMNLNNCEERQQTCLGNLNSAEQKLNESEINLHKANEDCTNKIANQNDENKVECDHQASAARVDLLVKLQELLGHRALAVLEEANVDLAGVKVDTGLLGSHSMCDNQPPINTVNQNPPSNNIPVFPNNNNNQPPGGNQLNSGLPGGDNENMLPVGVAPNQPHLNNVVPVVGDGGNAPVNGLMPGTNLGGMPFQPVNPVGEDNNIPHTNNDLPSANDNVVPVGADHNVAPVDNGMAPLDNNNDGPQAGLDPLDPNAQKPVTVPVTSPKTPEGDNVKEEEEEDENEEMPIGLPIGQEPKIGEDHEIRSPSTFDKPEEIDGPDIPQDHQLHRPPGLGDDEEEEDDTANIAPIGIQDVRDETEDKEDDFDEEIDPNEKSETLKFGTEKERDVNGVADLDGEEDTIDNMHQKMSDDAKNLDSPQDLEDQINV